MDSSIQHRYFFSHAPAVVWEYLTTAELMSQWLMPNDFYPAVGHTFQFRSGPAPALDFDGIVYCTVIEIVPLKKLVYSWKCGPGPGRITVDSLVTWTLQAKEAGTELLLHHTGLKGLEAHPIYAAMEEGWLRHIRQIDEKITAASTKS